MQWLTGIVFETAWFGTTPTETHGEPYTPGAERVLYGELPNAGVYPMTEELRTFKWLPRNKGYQLTFGLAGVPFYYNTTSGPAGQLGGTWEWVDVHAVGKKETYMLWNIYACFSSAYELTSETSAMVIDSQGLLITFKQRLAGPQSPVSA
ncbi:similar to An09g00540 [Aspergillus luchuensis]|uniref:Similar to An09g00540 n=1 Tax=Aspergillus kawachii TaxID=1069201 RepID=A0A146F414_ASPKA|nr:similar to An09g00540 [Aspergillus luchuensis]